MFLFHHSSVLPPRLSYSGGVIMVRKTPSKLTQTVSTSTSGGLLAQVLVEPDNGVFGPSGYDLV